MQMASTISNKELQCIRIRNWANNEIASKEMWSSEEDSSGREHGSDPQLLPPFDPHECHDDHIEDILVTMTELESGLRRGKGARSVELSDNCLTTVIELELVGRG